MLRALSVLIGSATVYAGSALLAVSRLPAYGVAQHVNMHGVVDARESRVDAVSGFLTFGEIVVGLAVLTMCLVRWLPFVFVNIPHKSYWSAPERRQRARRMAVMDVAVIFGLVLVGFSWMPLGMASATSHPDGSTSSWLTVLFCLSLAAVPGYLVWMYLHRYRPSNDG